MNEYPAKYTASGSEATIISNDGTTLRMSIRGVTFESTDFDSLEPLAETDPASLGRFTLNRKELCSCRIECNIPIPVVKNELEIDGTLFVQMDLGNPVETGGLDAENLRIVLKCQNQQFLSSGTSGWFGDELLDIQKQLPKGVYRKACINCMFSDYSPFCPEFQRRKSGTGYRG